MAIYDKPVRILFRDMVEELDLQPGQILSKQETINWFNQNYPKVKNGTISAHLIRLSVNAPSRIHYSAKPGDDDLFFQIDGSHFRLYEPQKDPTPIYISDTDGGQELKEIEEEEGQQTEFAYERDLQNFLAKNLHLIEPGLKLFEEEDVNGLEFPAGGRFIDILAIDSNDDYVVIELKVSKGYDRVIGQLLRYMAWIEANQADEGQKVHGIIIARNISEDLKLACSKIPDARLFEYQLSITLQQL